MNAITRIPAMSLYEDAFANARAMHAELSALEGAVGAEPCRPLHAAMWAAAKSMAGHLGVTPSELLGEQFRSGGAGEGKEDDGTP